MNEMPIKQCLVSGRAPAHQRSAFPERLTKATDNGTGCFRLLPKKGRMGVGQAGRLEKAVALVVAVACVLLQLASPGPPMSGRKVKDAGRISQASPSTLKMG
jgi:hypothetical protein